MVVNPDGQLRPLNISINKTILDAFEEGMWVLVIMWKAFYLQLLVKVRKVLYQNCLMRISDLQDITGNTSGKHFF